MKVLQSLIHTKVLSAASNPINIYKSIDDDNFKNCVEIQDCEDIEDDPVD